MPIKKEKLMIIDGNALIHRSFHALPPTITNKAGEPTNAVYGFTSVLLKALKEFKPKYIVLTLDKKGPTFRHKKYKEYKATRKKAPDELYQQFPKVKAVARAFNIPIFEQSGFEADDLIGTIAKTVKEDVEKIIITGDKDTYQLVNDHVKIYMMSKGVSESILLGEAEVVEKMGITANQVIDYKALRGDPGDNIPGVAGIGDKGAVNLLTDFQTLDGIYENIESDKIKDRTRNLLKESKEKAYLSYDLATIKCDVPMDFVLEDCVSHDFDKQKVVDLFSELEFKSLLPRLQALGVESKEEKDCELVGIDKFTRNEKMFKYELIDTDEKFELFLIKLKKQKIFTFDTETTGVNPLKADILGISFSWKEGEAYYIKIVNNKLRDKNKAPNLFDYQKKEVKNSQINHPWILKLKPIFENANIKKCAHNMKFDMRIMQHAGVETKGIYFDTILASYLLNLRSRQNNLDALTFSELGFEKISKDDLIGKGRDKITFSEVETKKMSLYSCEDADFTNRLVEVLKKELEEKKSFKLFKEIEMPLIPVLALIENTGVLLDVDILKKLDKKLDKKIKKLESEIWELAGEEFNIASPKQMQEILFFKLEIPTLNIAKTKTGISTAASELEKLKNEHKIIPLIHEHREFSKLMSTYITALPELVNKDTGRIHTSFNQTVVATGRLSSANPNLQNIPTRTEMGQEIRKAFVAEKGYKIVSLDYSQIELRLAAHMSGDKKMIDAFNEGFDIHTATAAEINGVRMEDVTKQMRRESKAINFGILYGQGPFGLSQSADIPFAQAKEFIEDYFKAYAGVKKYIDLQIEKVRETGYAETLFGRKRYLADINSSVPMVRKGAERNAINSPLQGTNADMIKKAMIMVDEMINKEYQDDARMLIQVHDELIFEIKENKVTEISEKIRDIMSRVLKLKVPVLVDVEVGDNWGELSLIET